MLYALTYRPATQTYDVHMGPLTFEKTQDAVRTWAEARPEPWCKEWVILAEANPDKAVVCMTAN